MYIRYYKFIASSNINQTFVVQATSTFTKCFLVKKTAYLKEKEVREIENRNFLKNLTPLIAQMTG